MTTEGSPRGQNPQGLQPAPAGGPSFIPEPLSPENLDKNILESRFNPTGSGQVGRVGGIPGSAERAPKTPRRFSRRKFLGLLATAGATVAAGGGIGAFLSTRGESSTKTPQTPDAQQGGGGATPNPTEAGASPTATEAATSPAKPLETVAPKPEGSRGNVASVKELKIPEPQKEAINKMLENATTQIIVEKNGQVVIIAIDNEMLKAAEKGERLCPTVVGSTAMEPCPILTSVEMNDKGFPDANDRLIDGVLEAKYQAWKAKSGDTSVTKEQFLSQMSQKDFSFPLRAYDVFNKTAGKVQVDEDSPYVFIFRNDPNDPRWSQGHGIAVSDQASISHFTGNGVIGQEVYMSRSFGVGGVINKNTGNNSEETAFASMLVGMITDLSNKADLAVIGNGRSTQSESLVEQVKAIRPHFYRIKDGQYDISEPWSTIFVTSGIKVNKP